MGYFEYLLPAKEEWKRVRKITVRAHLQPVPPPDARAADIPTEVTLFINGIDCGSRLIPKEDVGQAVIQTWQVDSWLVLLEASRTRALSIRFAVTPTASHPFGLNISNWPEGYDTRGAKPVEVEVR
jgi:predicted transcriptional regulator